MKIPASRVTVRLTGGPGNQLFQVVAALAAAGGDWGRIRVAASPDKDLRVVERLLGTEFLRVSRAQMFIGGFLPQHRLRWLRRRTKALQKRVRSAASVMLPTSTARRPATEARAVDPTRGSIRRVGGWAFAGGYFQDADWAPEHSQTVADLIIRNGRERIRTYASAHPAVNVRGGDYRRNGWELQDAYYERVVGSGFLDGYTTVSVVGVDERDVERVANLLERCGLRAELPQAVSDPLEAALRDFFVMVSAPRVVMSNSTFCWWATRVSPAERRVAYPSGWIDHDPATPLSRALKLPAWEAFPS